MSRSIYLKGTGCCILVKIRLGYMRIGHNALVWVIGPNALILVLKKSPIYSVIRALSFNNMPPKTCKKKGGVLK